jgi:hypothetical protein
MMSWLLLLLLLLVCSSPLCHINTMLRCAIGRFSVGSRAFARPVSSTWCYRYLSTSAVAPAAEHDVADRQHLTAKALVDRKDLSLEEVAKLFQQTVAERRRYYQQQRANQQQPSLHRSTPIANFYGKTAAPGIDKQTMESLQDAEYELSEATKLNLGNLYMNAFEELRPTATATTTTTTPTSTSPDSTPTRSRSRSSSSTTTITTTSSTSASDADVEQPALLKQQRQSKHQTVSGISESGKRALKAIPVAATALKRFAEEDSLVTEDVARSARDVLQQSFNNPETWLNPFHPTTKIVLAQNLQDPILVPRDSDAPFLHTSASFAGMPDQTVTFVPPAEEEEFQTFIWEDLEDESDVEIEQIDEQAVLHTTEAHQRPQRLDHKGRAAGVGRRKSAIARALVYPVPKDHSGRNTILINNKPLVEYFTLFAHRDAVVQPLVVTEALCKYQVRVSVSGGGTRGMSILFQAHTERARESDVLFVWSY